MSTLNELVHYCKYATRIAIPLDGEGPICLLLETRARLFLW